MSLDYVDGLSMLVTIFLVVLICLDVFLFTRMDLSHRRQMRLLQEITDIVSSDGFAFRDSEQAMTYLRRVLEKDYQGALEALRDDG